MAIMSVSTGGQQTNSGTFVPIPGLSLTIPEGVGISALIILNVLVYVLSRYLGDLLVLLFALWPIGSPPFALWQIVTYSFLHAEILHIVVFEHFDDCTG